MKLIQYWQHWPPRAADELTFPELVVEISCFEQWFEGYTQVMTLSKLSLFGGTNDG